MEQIINEEINEGATFYGFEVELYETIDEVDIPVSLEGSTVEMEFKNGSGKITKSLSTDNNGITTTGNKIIVAEMQDIGLAAGTHQFDFKITLENGDIIPGFAPGTLKVNQVITK